MGFFRPAIEKQLEGLYASMLGVEMARTLLGAAKAKLSSDRSFETPPIPLGELHADGVTSADWSWWWGHQPLERAMMVAVDEATVASAFVQLRQQGQSQEDAHATVRRAVPVFGDPRRQRDDLQPDDRPLPRELKNRVTEAAPRLAAAADEHHSSMNAQVRDWVRRGKL